MNIIFITHPEFLNFRSICRFSTMLANGMTERGHTVEIWSPKARFFNLAVPSFYKKWMGYIDQYILFPSEVKKRLNYCLPNTMFVLTDNALGPLVPLFLNHPHVIHCHDFLAQFSALGKIAENPISWTGKKYQAFIKRGYLQGSNFLSVSKKTQQDLHQFLSNAPAYSEVLYNGLSPVSVMYEVDEAKNLFSKQTGIDLTNGYLLHVGGNQWYKNRGGVVTIYNSLRLNTEYKLPLILIGDNPDEALLAKKSTSPFESDIYFLDGVKDATVQMAYTGASALIFPSLAEGFGWPIAEAMAAGCPVITTNEAPMTEVGGEAALYIPRMPPEEEEAKRWAIEAAMVVADLLKSSCQQRKEIIEAGLINIEKFNAISYLDKIENIYKHLSVKASFL